jgi:hypothetical protein
VIVEKDLETLSRTALMCATVREAFSSSKKTTSILKGKIVPIRTLRILLGVVLAVGVASTQPAYALGGGDGGGGDIGGGGGGVVLPPPAAVTITGPSSRATPVGATVTVAGTATPASSVGVWFHRAGSTGYVQRRTVTASSTGAWSTTYIAGDDYRIYATDGADQTAPILVQVAPTIAGAASQVVRKGSTYTIRGTAIPANTVTVHFHKAGTPASDYSIVRSVPVGGNATWTRPYVASTDYRFFASLPNGQVSPTVLVQAR